MVEVSEAINRRLRTCEEHVRMVEERIASVKKLEASYRERLGVLEEQGQRNSPEYARIQDWLKSFCGEERIRVLDSEILRAKGGDFPRVMQATAYKSNAEKLGAYWSRPTELFARAFECAVYDAMKDKGYCNQYLVHSVEGGFFAPPMFEGDPYPNGAERARINEKMSELLQSIAATSSTP